MLLRTRARLIGVGAGVLLLVAAAGTAGAATAGGRLEAPGLSATLGPDGLMVHLGSTAKERITLQPLRLRRGRRTRELPARCRPAPAAGRLECDRGALLEWLRRSPGGLEHGFDLPRRPLVEGGEPLELELGLEGTATARLAPKADGIVAYGTDGRRIGSYAGLQARDALGRRLPARMLLADRRLTLRVDDAGARYPLVIDPLVTRFEQEIFIPDYFEQDWPGGQVRLKLDSTGRNTLAIEGEGIVLVFERRDGQWIWLEQVNGNAYASAGVQLALAAFDDGWLVLAGYAPTGNPDMPYTPGEAMMYRRGPDGFELTQKIIPSGSMDGDWFGHPAAIDGSTMVVLAAPCESPVLVGPSTAYMFSLDGDTWSEQQTLTLPPLAEPCPLTGTVALSGDLLALGTRGSAYQGSVLLYGRQGSSWPQRQQIEGWFARRLALDDGTLAVAAADQLATDPVDRIEIYEARGGALVPSAEIQAGDCPVGYPHEYCFARNIDLWNGVLMANRPTSQRVELYGKEAGDWQRLAEISPPDEPNHDWDDELFGHRAALGGGTLAVAAMLHSHGSPDQRGAIFIYRVGWTDGESCSEDGACMSGHCEADRCCSPSCEPGAEPSCRPCPRTIRVEAGCGCRAAGRERRGGWPLLLLAAAVVARRRRCPSMKPQ